MSLLCFPPVSLITNRICVVFLFFVFATDLITLSNRVALVSFSDTQIILEWKLRPWPSHLPSSLSLFSLFLFPQGLRFNYCLRFSVCQFSSPWISLWKKLLLLHFSVSRNLLILATFYFTIFYPFCHYNFHLPLHE